ncbi:hypothetical protein GCM10009651_22320 [Microbacterium natoriense]|uniref:hypothetical protein n=1 Tax=Microbacterium natoriense TaxID=284570 RepID=UPI0031DBE734
MGEGGASLAEVPVGWHPLLRRLDEQLSMIDPAYVVFRVTSTFGALEFAARAAALDRAERSRFGSVIEDAAWESITVCEVCGGEARQYVIRLRVWTVCAGHAHEIAGTAAN